MESLTEQRWQTEIAEDQGTDKRVLFFIETIKFPIE